MNSEKRKLFIPLLFLFIMVNGLCIAFSPVLMQHQLDNEVVIVANTLLFLISALSLYLQIKGSANTNPHAMVRGVMGSVTLKLFVLGTAAFLYLYIAGEKKSVNALFVSMGLYIVYTWLEVRIALKIKPDNNGGN